SSNATVPTSSTPWPNSTAPSPIPPDPSPAPRVRRHPTEGPATRHATTYAMHPLSILLLALALSTDAFAAAVAKGAAVLRPRWRDALWTAAMFAIIAGLAPVAGWLAGSTAPVAIRNWDHWIAFILLSLLGAHMLAKAARTADDRDGADSPRISLLAAFLAALATSVDALAVGVGLAFVDVRIAPVAAVIAACTFLAVALGVMAGRALGTMIGRRAEAVGGIILILTGALIAWEHTSAAGA